MSTEEGIEIVDAGTLRRRFCFLSRLRPLTAVTFTPDGRFLAAGSLQGWVRLWSTETWKPVSLKLPAETERGACRSRSARTASARAGARRQRPALRPAYAQPLGAPLPGAPEPSAAPLFTPDGAFLFAVSAGGRAVPLGRPPVRMGPPRVRGRRAPAHPRRVGRRPPGPRLRPGLPALAGPRCRAGASARTSPRRPRASAGRRPAASAMVATPMLAPSVTRRPSSRTCAFSACAAGPPPLRRRLAAPRAARRTRRRRGGPRGRPGAGRGAAARRRSRSSSSPAAWPRASLTPLKPSRSM